MNPYIGGLLSVMLVALGIALIRVRDLFATMALLSAFSGLIAVLLAVLGAVDVAFTEAVVGASISTVLLMTLLRRIDPREVVRQGPLARAAALAGVGAIGFVLLWGIDALPPFGDPQSAPTRHVAPAYIERALQDTATPNVVTAVLADYRSFDTLIETTVILTAAMACILLLGRKP
ncbi:MAG: DUF4040 domain-containing protein [Planctomycetes bacterium]|nr:DUF4040 domain-containing protein [Planctomycetota bacterium]